MATPPLDADSCKLDAIQADLAYLFAINGSLDTVVGAMSAILWGSMSDQACTWAALMQRYYYSAPWLSKPVQD